MKKKTNKEIKYRSVKLQFAKNLKEARAARGFTQEEMEEKFNLDLRYYQRLEAGVLNPTFETLIYLSQCLKTKIELLLKDC